MGAAPGGVYDAGTASGFPIPPERRIVFSKDESVWHCAYSANRKPKTPWLTG